MLFRSIKGVYKPPGPPSPPKKPKKPPRSPLEPQESLRAITITRRMARIALGWLIIAGVIIGNVRLAFLTNAGDFAILAYAGAIIVGGFIVFTSVVTLIWDS